MNTNEKQETSDEPVASGVQISMLIDDLRWSHAHAIEMHWWDEQALFIHGEWFREMLAGYAEQTEFYSDGSPIGEKYLETEHGRVRYPAYRAINPPHRRRCLCGGLEVDQRNIPTDVGKSAPEVMW